MKIRLYAGQDYQAYPEEQCSRSPLEVTVEVSAAQAGRWFAIQAAYQAMQEEMDAAYQSVVNQTPMKPEEDLERLFNGEDPLERFFGKEHIEGPFNDH